MISSLSIVVPAYNEEANLASTVLAANEVLQNRAAEQLEWILVDDGSADGTWSEAQRLVDTVAGVVPLRHQENRGLGAAIWTGMAHASGDWCTWMPADGQFDPQAFVDMAHLADGADLVLLMRDEGRRAWWRQILTAAFYGWIRVMLGFDPYGYSGIFLVRREFVQAIPLHSTTGMQNYAVAIHCQRRKGRIRQTRTVVRLRLSGRSKVANLPTMLRTFVDIIRFRFGM
jgi:glycosyltransferase involved in cell wall biosynthesis